MRKIRKYALLLIALGVLATINYITKENNKVSLAATKEVLKESNVEKSYGIEVAKEDKGIIYLTDTEEYINKDKVEYFLKQVADKKLAKVRYTQYSGEFLDKMRDVEFDGGKIILREYDTKSPEGEKYYYIEITGKKIELMDSYYKLVDNEGNYVKLFPQ